MNRFLPPLPDPATLPLARRLLPYLLRGLAVAILARPALEKMLRTRQQVRQFRALGVPYPALTLPLAGALEVIVLASLALGIAGRVFALAQAALNALGLVFEGPKPQALAMIAVCLGIARVGTGRLSVWNPGERFLRWAAHDEAGGVEDARLLPGDLTPE